jgi:hypothetical protein
MEREANPATGQGAVTLETFLEELFAIGDMRLSPEAIDDASLGRIEYSQASQFFLEGISEVELVRNLAPETRESIQSAMRAHLTNRLVLLGGPGQGKTTLG